MSVQQTQDTIEQQSDAHSAEATQATNTEQAAASEDTEGDGAAQAQETQQQEQQDRDEKGRFKGVQPRIDELTRARREAERERDYWRGVASERQQASAQTSDDKSAPTKPTPDQFENYADFVEALTDWKTDQKVAKTLEERDAKAAQRQQAEKLQSNWTTRQQAFREATPDYDEVVNNAETPVARHVADALMDSEHGPAVAYHFAKHPEELARLNAMTPRQADREIGRLEERLTAAAAKPATTTKSAAPTPLTPVKPSASTSVDPARLTDAEWAAQRLKRA